MRCRYSTGGTRAGKINSPAADAGAAAAALVVAGAQRGLDHAEEAAQDAVLVQRGDAVEQADEGLARGLHLRLAV